ncbi:MAG: hypothetical protein ACOCX9_07565 [Spirochaetota bacterium]
MYCKKIFMLIMTILLLISASSNIFAIHMNAGASVWYAWWDPMWENAFKGDAVDNPDNYSTDDPSFSMDPSFLAGPALSFTLNPLWSISASFMYGKYDADSTASYFSAGGFEYKELSSISIDKMESDVMASRKITDIFKFYFGIKFQRYAINEERKVENYDMIGTLLDQHIVDYDETGNGIGSGAGIGITQRLYDNFFLLANVSAILMWNNLDRTTTRNDDTTFSPDIDYNIDFLTWGANTTASIAYYIAPASVTLAIGGRYQHLRYKQLNQKDERDLDGNTDNFYGITFSALYGFEI